MGELFQGLPSWVGTLPQWGILLSFVFAMWKITFADSTAMRKELNVRISELKRDHSECVARMLHLQKTIDGMRRQRVSEQIAMMRAILRTVEDPTLRKQLEMLEALEINLQYVGEVTGDADA